jgi:SAM-dependent methyltransferase
MRIGKKVFVGRKSIQYYKGMMIKADLDLHAQIADLLQKELPAGATILDYGAGEGALSARLKDNGFCVTAADIDLESFKCPEIPFTRVDFDLPAEVDAYVSAHENVYDAVIGVEVIEHVQDQWKYARQLMTMVKPGGLVLVSTPNTTSWLSRAIFFRTGHFHQFADSDLEYGHISPVTSWELGLILKSAGGTEIEVRPAGTLPPVFLSGFNRMSLMNLMILPFRMFMRGNLDGWSVIATARKR